MCSSQSVSNSMPESEKRRRCVHSCSSSTRSTERLSRHQCRSRRATPRRTVTACGAFARKRPRISRKRSATGLPSSRLVVTSKPSRASTSSAASNCGRSDQHVDVALMPPVRVAVEALPEVEALQVQAAEAGPGERARKPPRRRAAAPRCGRAAAPGSRPACSRKASGTSGFARSLASAGATQSRSLWWLRNCSKAAGVVVRRRARARRRRPRVRQRALAPHVRWLDAPSEGLPARCAAQGGADRPPLQRPRRRPRGGLDAILRRLRAIDALRDREAQERPDGERCKAAGRRADAGLRRRQRLRARAGLARDRAHARRRGHRQALRRSRSDARDAERPRRLRKARPGPSGDPRRLSQRLDVDAPRGGARGLNDRLGPGARRARARGLPLSGVLVRHARVHPVHAVLPLPSPRGGGAPITWCSASTSLRCRSRGARRSARARRAAPHAFPRRSAAAPAALDRSLDGRAASLHHGGSARGIRDVARAHAAAGALRARLGRRRAVAASARRRAGRPRLSDIAYCYRRRAQQLLPGITRARDRVAGALALRRGPRRGRARASGPADPARDARSLSRAPRFPCSSTSSRSTSSTSSSSACSIARAWAGASRACARWPSRAGPRCVDLHDLLPDAAYSDAAGHLGVDAPLDAPPIVAERIAQALLAARAGR